MPASIELVPLSDPTLERVGFPLDDPYLEQVYCSVLGPTSVLLLRRAAVLFAHHPQGARVDLVDLSRSLGVGVRGDGGDIGRNSQVFRTMDRIVQFRIATWLDDERLGIHRKVPAVAKHRAAHLPASVQAVHHQLLTVHLAGLVARAEGREPLARALVEPARALAPEPKREPPGSEVAARLRAFGTNGHDPREVVR